MCRIGLRQRKRRHGNRIIVGRQALLLQLFLRHVGRFRIVAGKKALVESFMRLQGGLVSQQHLDELKGLDVSAEDHEAYGQGGRQQQSDRPPEEGPEQR